jgi:S-adenosylhomocysteine hydrolase
MRKKDFQKKLLKLFYIKKPYSSKRSLKFVFFHNCTHLHRKNARGNTSLETQKTPIKHSKEAPISNKKHIARRFQQTLRSKRYLRRQQAKKRIK